MTIDEFLASPMCEGGKVAFTRGEIRLVKFQFGILGDFGAALFNAIFAADNENRSLLARGFPEDVAAVQSWCRSDLAARLRALPLEGI